MLHQSKDREKMGNCMVLDVTAIFFWITAFLKKLPFLAKGLRRNNCAHNLTITVRQAAVAACRTVMVK